MQPGPCHMEPAWNLSSSLNTFSLWGASQAITGCGGGAGGSSKESGQEKAVKDIEADGNIKPHVQQHLPSTLHKETLLKKFQSEVGVETLTVIQGCMGDRN